MIEISRSDFVRAYIDRVVNDRDITAVSELVATTYRGGGYEWPADFDSLLAFYEWQQRARPDWRIDVRESLELGDSVVVRATAGGTVETPSGPGRHDVEWLTHYRVVDGKISEITVLEIVDRTNT